MTVETFPQSVNLKDSAKMERNGLTSETASQDLIPKGTSCPFPARSSPYFREWRHVPASASRGDDVRVLALSRRD